MEQEKNQQKIYESINQVFQDAFELKDQDFFRNFLKFSSRVPQNAPFNNALVFIQNPSCTYFATVSRWKKFGRTIKKGARPMLILMPFGPVEFVYDIKDTEGGDLPDEEILNWWQEREVHFDERIFKKTIQNIKSLGIRFVKESPFEYFDMGSPLYKLFKSDNFRTAGVAKMHLDSKDRSIALHPRYDEPSVEAYGVLCHEIAHHLLGHIGEVVYQHQNKKREISRVVIAHDRRDLMRNIKELEAEITAWLVFNHFNLKKQSEAYLASWIMDKNDLEFLNVVLVFKVAGLIQRMGEKIVYR